MHVVPPEDIPKTYLNALLNLEQKKMCISLNQRFPTGGEFPPRGEFSISQGGNSSLPRLKKIMLNMRQKQFSN